MSNTTETTETARTKFDGVIECMGKEGDTKVMWDRHNTDEVEAARRTFKDLRAKKFLAFKTKKDGSQGEQIDDFDASQERIIMVPPMAGG